MNLPIHLHPEPQGTLTHLQPPKKAPSLAIELWQLNLKVIGGRLSRKFSVVSRALEHFEFLLC